MGSDGTDGAADIVAAGGSVIAQDEATSVVWGMPGSAAQAGVCSAVLPLDQIAPKVVRMFLGSAAMTPSDYDFLRKMLKARSGLVLSAEKHYLVESRLMPIARKHGLFNLTGLVAKLKGPDAEALIVEVVEAMTTNESFFFRDKSAVRAVPRHRHAGAAGGARGDAAASASGARPPRPGRSPIRSRCASRRWARS